ncbi:MAG TPA: hypothetical protein VG754_04920 [Verrucomicrobiae bacterium]|nr:hypothetical protein [Verrucomicrobiae bacterium]
MKHLTTSLARLFAARFQSAIRNPQPAITFANIGEGSHFSGNKSYLPDVAIANRFNLVVIGSSQNNVTPSAANTDIPLGVCTDSPESTNLDVPVNVALLGCANGTLKIVLGGTVNAGDMLQSNGDGTAIKLLTTTGTFYNIGRALMSGVAGDTLEFAHTFPQKVVNS